MTKGQEKNRERDDALQQFTYMLEEADGYVDLLDWNNLLGKSYCKSLTQSPNYFILTRIIFSKYGLKKAEFPGKPNSIGSLWPQNG